MEPSSEAGESELRRSISICTVTKQIYRVSLLSGENMPIARNLVSRARAHVAPLYRTQTAAYENSSLRNYEEHRELKKGRKRASLNCYATGPRN